MTKPPAVRLEQETKDRKDLLMVNWELGNTCNYECSYCPAELHDGSHAWPTHDAIVQFVERLVALTRPHARTIHIQFTGGEVTLVRGLGGLLRTLRDLGCRLSIISNGSRSVLWWTDLLPQLDAAVLTFHPESAKIEHFERVVQLLSASIRTHVNVTAPPAFFESALAVFERLGRLCPDTTMLLKPLLVDFGDQLYPYSAEQLEILTHSQREARVRRSSYDPRGDMLVTYADGSSARKGPSTFVADGTNQWFGWECDVGLELLSIDMDGRIYRSLCREGGELGHISDPGSFALPVQPVACTRDRCSCLLDIMTSRRKPVAPESSSLT